MSYQMNWASRHLDYAQPAVWSQFIHFFICVVIHVSGGGECRHTVFPWRFPDFTWLLISIRMSIQYIDCISICGGIYPLTRSHNDGRHEYYTSLAPHDSYTLDNQHTFCTANRGSQSWLRTLWHAAKHRPISLRTTRTTSHITATH